MIEQISLRKTFGECLEKLGGKNKNLVVLDSDLSNSLYSLNFAKSFPDRHFTVGMGENAMLSMAAGMTARGKLPFVCGETSQLLFKGLDSIKNSIAYPNLNIKIIGSNSGLTNAEEGTPRMCTNDLAILNSLPNLKILAPVDSIELKSMMEFMISDFGPTFLRLPKISLPNIYDANYQFKLGEPDLIQKGDKITIFSYGHMIHECLKTCSELANRGIASQVINVSTLNPLNTQKILDIIQLSELIFTVEDHQIPGGLGSLIIELLHKNELNSSKVISMGITGYPETASHYQDMLQRTGLNAKAIYEKIRESWLEH